MWFYLGGGWFFRREQGDIFRIVVLSAEATEAHGAATVLAETTFDAETFVRLLAHLTQQARPTVLQFITVPSPPG